MVALFIWSIGLLIYTVYCCYRDIKDIADEQRLPEYIKTTERRR